MKINQLLLGFSAFLLLTMVSCTDNTRTSNQSGEQSVDSPSGQKSNPMATEEHGISDVPFPTDAQVNYSPYPEQDFPNQVLFGDTHLHTSYSTDAGMVGAILGPEEAYRFARGERITSNHGLPVQLKRPLDFLVIADHAENLGLSPLIKASDPSVLSNEWGKMVHDLVKSGKASQAFNEWVARMQALDDPFAGDTKMAATAWKNITAAAEKYNEPGRFTAIIGFEWTSGPNGDNLHRNVLFKDGKDKADQIIPISYYDTSDPEELWKWMDNYETKTGGRMLAIPHNGNISNGLMFDDETLTTKEALSRDYAERRNRWEPVYEVTQPKGDGETHPLLSPNDEFADFETWDKGSFGPAPHTEDMLPREYAREALKRGLVYEEKLGANPFKFGMIGSTDAHTGLATTSEDNWFGKVALLEPSANPIRFKEVIIGRVPKDRPEEMKIRAAQTAASGLAAVWSRENTREAIWNAFERREVFATTGTRLRVRVFGGFNYSKDDLTRSDFASYGYTNGVPMGGDLTAAPSGKAPGFLVRAVRDPDGANLDRIQVIKGWVDADGNTQEKIYDIAVSGNRKIGSDGRCNTLVGNTVNVEEATFTNSIGTPFLETFWTDPDFNPAQRAFYYVRVLEIPTPRWTTIDAKVFGVERPENVPPSIQERAYSSPIWYTP
jgi:hypothetical protein